jgi:hypothetical protein
MFRLRAVRAREANLGVGRHAERTQAGDVEVDVEVMRRHRRGATTTPPAPRPGSGFGRPSHTGPPSSWREDDVVTQGRGWDPSQLLVEMADVPQHAEPSRP